MNLYKTSTRFLKRQSAYQSLYSGRLNAQLWKCFEVNMKYQLVKRPLKAYHFSFTSYYHPTFSTYYYFTYLKKVDRICNFDFVALGSLWTRKNSPLSSPWVTRSSTRVTIPIVCTHLHCRTFHLSSFERNIFDINLCRENCN